MAISSAYSKVVHWRKKSIFPVLPGKAVFELSCLFRAYAEYYREDNHYYTHLTEAAVAAAMHGLEAAMTGQAEQDNYSQSVAGPLRVTTI